MLPYYQGAAVMGLLFPLFILLAADASPADWLQAGASPPADMTCLMCFSCPTAWHSCAHAPVLESLAFGSRQVRRP